MWGFLELGYEDIRQGELRVPDAEYTQQEVTAIRREVDALISGHAKEDCLVATKDFSAAVAQVCKETGVLYLSWVHDSPQRALYMKEARYETNRIFVFDRAQYERLTETGVENVFHRPLAANVTRFAQPEITGADLSAWRAEISFVGNLYVSPGRDVFFSRLSADARQECEELLSETVGRRGAHTTVYRSLREETKRDMFAHFDNKGLELYGGAAEFLMQTATLAQEAACRERVLALQTLAKRFPVRLYTTDPEDAAKRIPGVDARGAVRNDTEMPLVFRASRINLNLTAPSIETGIPQRVFDIMSVGGFVVTDAQEEIAELFVPDEDLVTFRSMEELEEKVSYYLAHEDCRSVIAENGFRKVSERYTVPQAVEIMMKTVSSGKHFFMSHRAAPESTEAVQNNSFPKTV